MNLRTLVYSIGLFCWGVGVQSLSAETLDGSTAVVLKSTSYNFDADNDSPKLATGAVWFQSGFTLHEDAGSTLETQIDVAFPINGTIAMNGGGILKLLHDIWLGSDAAISGSGSIEGDSNAIYLSNDLTYSTNTLTIATSTIIDGANHHFTLASGGTISVSTSQTLTFKNMDLTLAGTLTMAAGSKLVLDNVRLHLPSGTTSFSASGTAATIDIYNHCSFDAPPNAIFSYESDAALTIKANSSLLVDNGLTFKHNNTHANSLFTFADVTSQLKMQGGTFESAAKSLSLETGTLWVEHHSYAKSSGLGSLTLGHATNDLAIEFLPGASLDISAGTVTYANAS